MFGAFLKIGSFLEQLASGDLPVADSVLFVQSKVSCTVEHSVESLGEGHVRKTSKTQFEELLLERSHVRVGGSNKPDRGSLVPFRPEFTYESLAAERIEYGRGLTGGRVLPQVVFELLIEAELVEPRLQGGAELVCFGLRGNQIGERTQQRAQANAHESAGERREQRRFRGDSLSVHTTTDSRAHFCLSEPRLDVPLRSLCNLANGRRGTEQITPHQPLSDNARARSLLLSLRRHVRTVTHGTDTRPQDDRARAITTGSLTVVAPVDGCGGLRGTAAVMHRVGVSTSSECGLGMVSHTK